MNRMAINVVRLVAGGFILVGILNLAACWIKANRTDTPVPVAKAALLSIPLVIGIAILAFGSKIAKRINDFLDQ
jgi:hypothetical protein